MYGYLLVFIGIVVARVTSDTDKSCKISIREDLSEPQPLILTNSEKPNFILPNERRQLIIARNTTILLACIGENNSFVDFGTTKILKASCVSEKQFSVASKVYLFNSFKCKRLPEETIKRSTNPCFDVHTKYEIGFEIGNHFLKLLEVCRDEINFRTFYSKHTLHKEIKAMQYRYKRPGWKSGPYYRGYDINNWYTYKSQRQYFENLLGSSQLADEYIHPYQGYAKTQFQSIHRGHLTPKSDFNFGVQQSATFSLLNTNPQWATFNAGNWMYLESDIRDLASSRQMDLIIYTGVYGKTTLKDVNNNEKTLYLYANNTEKLLPVPRFFWKIIHDPISNKATAFVGVNEPHADNITEDMYLCPDISSNYNFSWLTWKPNDIQLGVSYVCTVETLRKAVPSIPEIGEVDLLV